MRDFRRYEVWKRAIEFCKNIYMMTAELPGSEKYGIISQAQRASVSISSNIAEGCSRRSEKDFARFIEIAIGSAFETENLLLLCKELGYIEETCLNKMTGDLRIIQKQLNTLYGKLGR
jgi:four helix bundle protein